MGACGVPTWMPRLHVVRYRGGADVRVLVGGPGLWQVTGGSHVSQQVTVLPNQGLLVTKLVTGPGVSYAFAEPRCSGYLWVYRVAADAARRLSTTADDLLGGSRQAWAVTYRDRGVVLTPLDGGRTVTLPATTGPVADTAAGLVVAACDRRGARPCAVELVDPISGALVRRLAVGFPLGAAGHTVLVSLPDCGVPTAQPCALESVDLATGRRAATFELPAGRVLASNAVFSPDGTRAAFQLARPGPDLRVRARTASRPSDVAILNLRTGNLEIVPGLELAPGTQAGLAFGATSRWLLVTVSEGTHGELLAWRPGMPGPALVASLPGPLVAPPPLLSRR